jgi:DNA-directed RNA polymerase subunit RPC12/RpoP
MQLEYHALQAVLDMRPFCPRCAEKFFVKNRIRQLSFPFILFS